MQFCEVNIDLPNKSVNINNIDDINLTSIDNLKSIRKLLLLNKDKVKLIKEGKLIYRNLNPIMFVKNNVYSRLFEALYKVHGELAFDIYNQVYTTSSKPIGWKLAKEKWESGELLYKDAIEKYGLIGKVDENLEPLIDTITKVDYNYNNNETKTIDYLKQLTNDLGFKVKVVDKTTDKPLLNNIIKRNFEEILSILNIKQICS